MKISGDDLILIGLCFAIAGTLILSRGNIFKNIGTIRDEATMFYGQSPFLIKKGIIQKYEHVSGILLIIPAAIFQLVGIYLNKTKPKLESVFITPWYNLISLLLLIVCILWVAHLLSTSIAKNSCMPELKRSQNEGLRQSEYVLNNDGLYENERAHSQNINRGTRDSRLAQTRERLEMWGRLFNFKRKSNESDAEYFLRLKTYLDRY